MATKAKDRPPASPARTRHEDDLYTWVQEQVALLRAGRLSEVDALNVAEELGDVGRSEFRSLESAIAVLTMHLLKWDFQPNRRSLSWELTVHEQRERIADVLADNPGLKARLDDAVSRGYKYGRIEALKVTKLPKVALPTACPYSYDEIMSRPIVHEPPPPRRKKR